YAFSLLRTRPSFFFSLMFHRPPSSTLFPYTTLFRSLRNSNVFLCAAIEQSFIKYALMRASPLSAPPLHELDSEPRQSGQSRLKRSEEHTSELQSRFDLVCRLLLEKKKRL